MIGTATYIISIYAGALIAGVDPVRFEDVLKVVVTTAVVGFLATFLGPAWVDYLGGGATMAAVIGIVTRCAACTLGSFMFLAPEHPVKALVVGGIGSVADIVVTISALWLLGVGAAGPLLLDTGA